MSNSLIIFLRKLKYGSEFNNEGIYAEGQGFLFFVRTGSSHSI